MFTPFKIKTERGLFPVTFRKYLDVSNLESETKEYIFTEIDSVLASAWGNFPQDFVHRHILQDNRLLVARAGNQILGFCALGIKNISSVKVHYVEFLVVKKEFQNTGLGPHLFYLILRGELLKNFFKIPPKSLDVMFITPNIRVLGKMARFSSFIYPNPYIASDDGEISSADDLTWRMAQELISQSDNPNRRIDRNGLVLHGSYQNMPWLIYNNNNIPWHRDEKVNIFARRYLGYGNRDDKEFIVRAHVSLFSVWKYLCMLIAYKIFRR